MIKRKNVNIRSKAQDKKKTQKILRRVHCDYTYKYKYSINPCNETVR